MAKRLKTIPDVRRYVANLLNQIETDTELSNTKIDKLIKASNTMLKAVELEFQHSEVKAVFDAMQLRKKGPAAVKQKLQGKSVMDLLLEEFKEEDMKEAEDKKKSKVK